MWSADLLLGLQAWPFGRPADSRAVDLVCEEPAGVTHAPHGAVCLLLMRKLTPLRSWLRSAGRGSDAGCSAPPARIRASAPNAPGSRLPGSSVRVSRESAPSSSGCVDSAAEVARYRVVAE